MTKDLGATTKPDKTEWAKIAANPKFVELHRRKVRFLFGWWLISTLVYLAILLGAGLAPKLFAGRVIGDINFGYFFILSMFVYCWFIAAYYASWANRVSDKLTAELVQELKEGGVK
jgi:uncharacterized membrane protein (DUF485 family)